MSGQENLKTGERRIVTVLFSDMKGFTALSEKLDPEETDVLMTRVFSIFESIIVRYEGEVEKYIGDALVAVFGASRIHDDDPSRAVNAAADFLEAIRHENRELERKGLAVSFRTGIHTGLITTGKRGKYDVVTGHTMSVASRLQESAEPNTIYVSQTVKERCEDDFTFSEPIVLRVKGKADELTAYRVTGRDPDPLRTDEPFVGNAKTMSELLRLYLRHDAATASAFAIIGETGIGKSRVAARFIEKVRQLPSFSSPVLTARAQRFRPFLFSAVIDLLSDYYRIDLYGEPDRIASQLVSSYGIDAETAAGFSRMAGDGSEFRVADRAYVILARMFEHAVREVPGSPYPPIVYVDDIHNLDKLSRDFFQYYLKQDGVKPFFLFSGRDVPSSLREIFPEASIVALEPLSREEAGEYLRRLWPECRDQETVNTILTNSMGNPLFIREYVKLAKESKDVSALPMTLQNMFLMSLEKYPEELKQLLKKLSVFILSFTLEDARYIERKTECDPDAAAAALERFKADGILGQEGPNYFFRHDVFKKALYNSLLNYNKRILHRHVATLLREQRTEPNLPRLLQHLIKAEEYSAAREVLFREPNRGFSMEYLRFIDTLLEHTDPADYQGVIGCLFTKCVILFNNGKTEAVDSILKQILRIAVEQKNFEFSANAYHLLAAYNLNAYSFQKALFCGTKAIFYYRQMKDRTRSVMDLLRILSLGELLRNNLDGSAEYLRQMETIPGAEFEPMRLEARLERHLLLDEYREALACLPADEPGDLDRLQDRWFYAHANAVKLYWQLCDYESLKRLCRQMLAIGTKNFSILSQVQAQLAVSCLMTGEEAPVKDAFAQAEFYMTQIRNDFDLIDAMRTLSLCFSVAGNDARAEEIAREGITVGLRHSSYYPVFTMLVLLAEIYLKQAMKSEALFVMDEATFYVDLGMRIGRKDLVLYYYFRHMFDRDLDTLGRASALLEEEKTRIGEPRLVKAFMATRSFADLEAVAQAVGTGGTA